MHRSTEIPSYMLQRFILFTIFVQICFVQRSILVQLTVQSNRRSCSIQNLFFQIIFELFQEKLSILFYLQIFLAISVFAFRGTRNEKCVCVCDVVVVA